MACKAKNYLPRRLVYRCLPDLILGLFVTSVNSKEGQSAPWLTSLRPARIDVTQHNTAASVTSIHLCGVQRTLCERCY